MKVKGDVLPTKQSWSLWSVLRPAPCGTQDNQALSLSALVVKRGLYERFQAAVGAWQSVHELLIPLFQSTVEETGLLPLRARTPVKREWVASFS